MKLAIRSLDPTSVEQLTARPAAPRTLEAEPEAILREAAMRVDAGVSVKRVRDMLAGRRASDSADLIRRVRTR